MSNQSVALETVEVEFAGANLVCAKDVEDVWVNLKRACEGIGINYAGQFTKLKSKSWAVIELVQTTGSDGKNYEMSMIHLDSLPMWLGTVDENRVSEKARPKLIKFQKECARVLRDHFFGKPSTSSMTPAEITLANAQNLVDLERSVKAIEKDSLARQKVINEHTAILEDMSKNLDTAPPKQQRAVINELVKNIDWSRDDAPKTVASRWNRLYTEFRLRYSVDIKAKARNRNTQNLQFAQDFGHLGNLAKLAQFLYEN